MTKSEDLSAKAIDAWVLDIKEKAAQEFEYYGPIIQAEVIPLACVWCLAKAQFDKTLVSTFQFAQDVINHDEARELWRDRAKKAGDMNVSLDQYPYERMVSIYEGLDPWMPQRFELIALTDGRTEPQEFISGVELSLLSALGHAAYNSTSGTVMLRLVPTFGPPAQTDFDANAWFSQSGDHVLDFVKNEINLKTDH